MRFVLADSSNHNTVYSDQTLTIHVTNPATPGTIIFSDTLFNNSNWTASIIADNTLGGATVEFGQIDTGGNPGAYRRSKIAWTGGPGQTATVQHLLSGAIYNPSVSGAVNDITFSWSQNGKDTNGTVPGGYYGILLLQNGKIFISTPISNTSNTWFTQPGVTASQGSLFEFPSNYSSHPDFSASGGPMQLGYIVQNSANLSSKPGTSVVDVDNWSAIIHKK